MIKKTLISSYFVFLSLFSFAEIREINILHTNDLHSHLFPHIETWISDTREVGGFANLATLVKQEKESNPNTIYIDAGDYFSGPYVSTLTKGRAVINSMNFLGLDAGFFAIIGIFVIIYWAAQVSEDDNEYGKNPLIVDLGAN